MGTHYTIIEADRTIVSPVTGIELWLDVRGQVRRYLGRPTQAHLAASQLDAAIHQAVRHAWPNIYVEEYIEKGITDFPTTITLPWEPEDILEFAIREEGTAGQGYHLTRSAWALRGKKIYTLAREDLWPDGNVALGLRVIHRPFLNNAEEPHDDYCRVPIDLLVSLVEAELIRMNASDYELSDVEAAVRAAELRAQALALFPAYRRPRRQIADAPSHFVIPATFT
jgi:hypothetical protein